MALSPLFLISHLSIPPSSEEIHVKYPVFNNWLWPGIFILFLTPFAVAASPEKRVQGSRDLNGESGSALRAASQRPDVVFVMLDDVGFAATKLFGGPVDTPELNKLAAKGLRYNNFNTTAICSPTRASLLTGYNSHRVGFGNVTESRSDYPGYNMLWRKSTASVAEVLRQNGYSTAIFGKWHNTPYSEISPVGPFDRWPTGLGFEYFYGFMQGENSQWEPQLYRGTVAVDPPKSPAEGYHFTADIADEAIAWVQTHRALAPKKPFFLYFSPGATHAPHHAPQPWIDKYRGKFDQGWDRLREQIFAQQKKSGVIPADAKLTPRPDEIPAWDSLSPDEKKIVARQMEVYAGFLAHTDYEVGRMLNEITKDGHGDNTLVFYIVGDNGASAEGGPFGSDFTFSNIGKSPSTAQQLSTLDGLGSVFYDNHFAVAWAWALDTPFQWTKQVASHLGGTRNPMIVSWPRRIKGSGGLRTQFTHVNDVVPTVYDAIGLTPPSVVNGVKQLGMDGVSFVYSFDHANEPSHHRVQYFEVRGNRAIYKDGWMASARHTYPWAMKQDDEYSHDRWELYDLTKDFSQAVDLAGKYPNKLTELKKVFEEEAEKNDVNPLGGGRRSGVAHTEDRAREFVYYPSLPRVPALASPTFPGSHRIVAHLDIPRSTDIQGVIFSYGSRFGGFVLYAKNGHIVYENNTAGQHFDKIVSRSTLPAGKVEVAYEFAAKELNKDNGWPAVGGIGKLYIDGALVGQGDIAFFNIMQYFGSLGVGRGYDSPISPAYEVPFKFNGTIEHVTVKLGDPPKPEGVAQAH